MIRSAQSSITLCSDDAYMGGILCKCPVISWVSVNKAPLRKGALRAGGTRSAPTEAGAETGPQSGPEGS